MVNMPYIMQVSSMIQRYETFQLTLPDDIRLHISLHLDTCLSQAQPVDLIQSCTPWPTEIVDLDCYRRRLLLGAYFHIRYGLPLHPH